MVYVLNSNGQPLMPTKRESLQPITLGVDAGSKHIVLSATTETEELYAGDVWIRNDIVDKLSTIREFRRSRRYRKKRYRKA